MGAAARRRGPMAPHALRASPPDPLESPPIPAYLCLSIERALSANPGGASGRQWPAMGRGLPSRASALGQPIPWRPGQISGAQPKSRLIDSNRERRQRRQRARGELRDAGRTAGRGTHYFGAHTQTSIALTADSGPEFVFQRPASIFYFFGNDTVRGQVVSQLLQHRLLGVYLSHIHFQLSRDEVRPNA